VAYYCPEPLSREAERLVRAEAKPSISDLTEVELLSAVSRKARLGELTTLDAGRVAAQFVAHLEAGLYARLALERRHYTLARDWIARFSTPLRTLDALHLAVAATEDLRFATADRALARAAEALGIPAIPAGRRA
jgi:predicted nucleic acid-binding protein